MKKMYSLMLTDTVVNAIDERAAAEGTNRSNLINQILAEYVEVVTPEQAIYDIFHGVDALLCGVMSPSYQRHDNTMVLKSPLAHRYRPTVRYDVELRRTLSHHFGVLKVSFRSRVPSLTSRLQEFFELWESLEAAYYASFIGEMPDSCYDCGKWLRTLILPRGNAGQAAISEAITTYVKILDSLLKDYMDGESAKIIEEKYLMYLNGAQLLI